jgi:hypothetical protein
MLFALKARHYGQLSFDSAPTVGDKAWANIMLQWALVRERPEAAIEHLAPMSVLIQTVGFKGLLAHCGLILCEAYLSAGLLDDAEILREPLKNSARVVAKSTGKGRHTDFWLKLCCPVTRTGSWKFRAIWTRRRASFANARQNPSWPTHMRVTAA